jgi:cytochrome c553
MCQACHGLNGLHRGPAQALPHGTAAGVQIRARKNDAMSVIAPSLSDADIEDLAAYFAAFVIISVGKLPGTTHRSF